MKKMILFCVFLFPAFLLLGDGFGGGDIVGGSVERTRKVLTLSQQQIAQLRNQGDIRAAYEAWKATSNPTSKEQALRHAFEKFILPQIDPQLAAQFASETMDGDFAPEE